MEKKVCEIVVGINVGFDHEAIVKAIRVIFDPELEVCI
jgi:hypothetical protein